MRELLDHVVTEADKTIKIIVTDAPGSGGANHHYSVAAGESDGGCDILFQNGPVAENGVNGITQEVLLAVVMDRLRSFQAGPFACKANACALTHIEEAMHWLQQRTIERMRRGVEGKLQA